MAEAWSNPWRELKRREDVRFALERLPDGVDGVCWPKGGRVAILVERSLGRRHRAAVLAHELTHAERGGGVAYDGMPDTWRAVVAREEQTVDRITAARLVPLDELAAIMREAEEREVAVHRWEIGELYDVSDEIAELAMRLVASR